MRPDGAAATTDGSTVDFTHGVVVVGVGVGVGVVGVVVAGVVAGVVGAVVGGFDVGVDVGVRDGLGEAEVGRAVELVRKGATD